ncbi:hypothetical protein B6440_26095 [Salmonella enterica]|nr:hypothetical protein [Salmonella enterica]
MSLIIGNSSSCDLRAMKLSFQAICQPSMRLQTITLHHFQQIYSMFRMLSLYPTIGGEPLLLLMLTTLMALSQTL